MAHFARIKNHVVQEVIVAEKDFIEALPNREEWVETSYNVRNGKRYDPETGLFAGYAKVGEFEYAAKGDFLRRNGNCSKRPFPSWKWVGNTFEPPTPKPVIENGINYSWNEDELKWKPYEIDISSVDRSKMFINTGYSLEEGLYNEHLKVWYTESGFGINKDGRECEPNTGNPI